MEVLSRMNVCAAVVQDDIIYAVDYNHRSEHVLQKTILDSFT